MKPEKKTKNVKVTKKKGNNTLIIGIVAVIIIAGAAYAFISSKQGIDKTPGSQITLPSYAYTNPATLQAYKYATERPDILEQIPCYCGCGGHSGHRFLRDCYIHDDRSYDEHASFCDTCVGEAIKVQEYLAAGKTLTEARALIDQEYGAKFPGQNTNTPPVSEVYKALLPPKSADAVATSVPVVPAVQPQVDLSTLSLADNFRSLSDGMKLIPAGVSWVYFANLKQGVGFEESFMPDNNVYKTPIIGMLNSEYPDKSFVDLHDIVKISTLVQPNSQPTVDNILYTRPFIYDSVEKTNVVLALMKDSAANGSAYNSYKAILDKVDDENAGFAKINTLAPSFADMSYIGLVKSGTDVKGEIAFRIKANESAPLAKYNELKNNSSARGFKSYEVLKENNTIVIKMTSDLNTVLTEASQNYGIDIRS
jgi:hypothetical protein